MSGFVYFIEREPGDFVKIGWAKYSPFARIKELQTGCPDLLYVRAFFPGSRDDEARMHRTFADLRGRGEWFANVLKLAEFLRYLDGGPEIIDSESVRETPLDRIADALHDCVYGGNWYPDYPVNESIYNDSGDWRPWRALLTAYFGSLEE